MLRRLSFPGNRVSPGRPRVHPVFCQICQYHSEYHNGRYNLPTTPDGRNPYAVFDIDPLTATPKSIGKRYKQLVVNNHPDRPGGSNEKMREINAAHAILRQHHEKYRQTLGHEKETTTASTGDEHFEYQRMKEFREESVKRRGGVPRGSASADPALNFESYKRVTSEMMNVMVNRYAFACSQGLWMRKHKCLVQLTARERWLVKGFLCTMRNDLRERKRHLESSKETMDEIDAFASEIEKELESTFARATRRTERRMKLQTSWLFTKIALGFLFLVTIFERTIYDRCVRNSYTVKFQSYFT